MCGKAGIAGTVGIAGTEGISLYPGIGARLGLEKGVTGPGDTSTVMGFESTCNPRVRAAEEVDVSGVMEITGNRGFLTGGANVSGGGRFLMRGGESARGGVESIESGEDGRPVIPDPTFVGVTTVSDSVDDDHGCEFSATEIRHGRGGVRVGSCVSPKSKKLSSLVRLLPFFGLAATLFFGREETEVDASMPHLISPETLSFFVGEFKRRG